MTYEIISESDHGGKSFMIASVELKTTMDWKEMFDSIDKTSKITIITYGFWGEKFVCDLLTDVQ
jgi:hypothetical protein